MDNFTNFDKCTTTHPFSKPYSWMKLCVSPPSSLWIASDTKCKRKNTIELLKLDCTITPPRVIAKLSLGEFGMQSMCCVENDSQELIIVSLFSGQIWENNELIALGAKTGAVEWRKRMSEPTSVTADKRGLIYAIDNFDLKLYSCSGRLLGEQKIGCSSNVPRALFFDETSSYLVISLWNDSLGKNNIKFIRVNEI